jgi:hypothetical protein
MPAGTSLPVALVRQNEVVWLAGMRQRVKFVNEAPAARRDVVRQRTDDLVKRVILFDDNDDVVGDRRRGEVVGRS